MTRPTPRRSARRGRAGDQLPSEHDRRHGERGLAAAARPSRRQRLPRPGDPHQQPGQQVKTLPSLLIPLKGDIQLNLRAQTSVDGAGRLITTFPSIPDAAVSNFQLTIAGGSRGILVVTHGKNLCTAKQFGSAQLGSQSGKTEGFKVRFGVPCQLQHKKHHKKHKKHKKHHKHKKHVKRH